jgi:Zn-finger nucleic acid-binding protein
MNCPQCKTVMKENVVGDVTINDCTQCRGMWFDRGNFEEVKDEVLPELGWMELDEWKDDLEFTVRQDSFNCPKCGDIALTTISDPKSATELSTCTQCQGTWLATGQFLNFVNALLEEADRKSAPEYVRILLGQAKEMFSDPESMGAEWKDFRTVLKLLYRRFFVEHPKLKSTLVGIQESLPL